jgi:hypothetical protein
MPPEEEKLKLGKGAAFSKGSLKRLHQEHLADPGIQVTVQRQLARVLDAYAHYLRRRREAHRVGMVQPTAEQVRVEKLFPAVARWVNEYGHIEIGDQEMFGFVVRALDHGGQVFEDDRPNTLAEGLAALEKGLHAWFKEQGIAVE